MINNYTLSERNPSFCEDRRGHFQLKAFTLLVFLFVSFLAVAQEGTISGKVTSIDNTPLPGVNILVRGTNRGTVSDADGNFKIAAKDGETLVFSQIGQKTVEQTINGQTDITIAMEDDITTLGEVVVTALGISQEKRSLGYAVQEVKGSDITQSKTGNVLASLQGRVAGARIQMSGGAPGAGVSILIRGLTSISPNRSSEPLFVIDGVPISNETQVSNVLPSSNITSPGSSEQYSFSNRAMDINPDDIESLTVLKGPAATGLYGLRGSNGVIVITTKKGSAGKPQIAYSGSMGWDEINKTPGIQTQYREGTGGARRIGVPGAATPFQTYGPLATENDPFYDNLRNFFQTGVRINNTLSVSGGNEKSTYYTSISNFNQKGIVPNSDWNRTTVKISGKSDLSDKLTIRGSATYTNSGGLRPQGGDKSIMSALTFHTPSADVNDYINPDGSIKSYAGTIIDNPRYLAEFSTMEDDVDRIIGYAGANLKITDWLTADYQLGTDFYGDQRVRIAPPGLDITANTNGFMVEERSLYREINSTFLLTATRSFNENLKGSLMVGNNIMDINQNQLNVRGEGFALKGFYDLSNTANRFVSEDGFTRRVVGVFADAKIDYKGIAYASITARNDWATTLPKANRSFFYPSISTGFVFSEAFHLENKVFSYGKIRASVAQVGKDASPYQAGQYYESAAGFPFNRISGFRKSSTAGDPNLRSELTTTLELGTDLKFYNNRLWIDVTAYNGISDRQIVEIPVSNVSGLARYSTNAGKIRNRGLEILFGATPVQTDDFKWDVLLNWSANRSKVLSMPEGINEIIFQDDRILNKIVVGGSIGDLYGRPYKRDVNGQLIIGADGFPTWTDAFEKVGNAIPDWMGGITNTVSWKGISLSFLVEVRQGGDVYDVGMRNRIRNGTDERTALRNVDVVFGGVLANGEPNTQAVRLDGDTYYRIEANYNGVADVLLQDASWVRLRSASLSYAFGKSLLNKTPFSALSLSASGNNLVLVTPFKGFDPEGATYGSGSNSFGYTGLNIPATRGVTLSLNATF
jgi:TonB-linked SusC/RagA family outer membrane protein